MFYLFLHHICPLLQALLQKKNRMLEEALQLALKAQEKVEKRPAERWEREGWEKT